MKNLVLVLILLISIVEINAQCFYIKKDTIKYDTSFQKETSWDSINNVLIVDDVLRTSEIRENIDTLERTYLEIVYKGNSKEFLKEFPHAFWNFEDLEENKRAELTREKVKEYNRNLKNHSEFQILYGIKRGNLLFLEIENKSHEGFNGVSIFWFSLICLFILILQLTFFVSWYKKFFKEKKGLRKFDVEDGCALFCYFVLSPGVLDVLDPLLGYLWLISFALGLIFRLGLLLNPPKKWIAKEDGIHFD